MRILVISGSIGHKSCTRTLLKYLEKRLKAVNIETSFWDMGLKPLPIAIPEYHNRPHDHPDKIVRAFVEAVTSADGYILGSPLYHGSYSGVLKNALDNLPHGAFQHKPVGLSSHSSNARSCVAPCNDLRAVVRSLDGYTAHLQIGTTDEDYVTKNSKLTLTNEKIKIRGELLIQELVALSGLLQRKH